MKNLENIDSVSYTSNKDLTELAVLLSSCLWSSFAVQEALGEINITEKVDLTEIDSNYCGTLHPNFEPAKERFDNDQGFLYKREWFEKQEKEKEEKVAKLLNGLDISKDAWKNYYFDSLWNQGRAEYDKIYKAAPRNMLVEKIKITKKFKPSLPVDQWRQYLQINEEVPLLNHHILGNI